MALFVTTCGCGGGSVGPNYIYEHLQNAFRQKIRNCDLLMCDTIPNKVGPNVRRMIDNIEWKHRESGYNDFYLIGWSMGGATVIQTAHQINNKNAVPGAKVKGIILFATQGAGTGAINLLNVPILFIHGKQDTVLTPECSISLYQGYSHQKQLVLIDKTSHGFVEIDPRVLVNGILRSISTWSSLSNLLL